MDTITGVSNVQFATTNKVGNDIDKEQKQCNISPINLKDVVKEYKQLCNEVNVSMNEKSRMPDNLQKELENIENKYFIIEKHLFTQLTNEVKIMNETLPKVLNKDLLQAPKRIVEKEREIQKVSSEKQSLEKELHILRKRYDAVLSEVEAERQENADLRKQVINWKAITEQQSDFCARLGVAVCSLLWRSTQIDEAVKSMLVGEHANNFFEVASHTLDYFVLAVEDKSLKLDELSAEYQFVVALLGVLTNLSASTDGRDALVVNEKGKSLLERSLTMMCVLPFKKSYSKLRNLCLKLVYNVSINEAGMVLLYSRKDLFGSLVDTLKNEKCTENTLQVIRILQSFLSEADSEENCKVITEHISFKMLKHLTNNTRGEVKDAFEELIADFLLMDREQ